MGEDSIENKVDISESESDISTRRLQTMELLENDESTPENFISTLNLLHDIRERFIKEGRDSILPEEFHFFGRQFCAFENYSPTLGREASREEMIKKGEKALNSESKAELNKLPS